MKQKLNEIIHELTSTGQMFHSYAELASNESFHINPKKIKEICHKCSLRCRDLRQALLEGLKEEV